MVLCPECGLNTCSAGENCNRCKEAYEYMYSHDAPVGAELQQLKDEEQAEYDKACAESPDNIYLFGREDPVLYRASAEGARPIGRG